MAKQLVECVPNFSEGRRADVIQAIVEPFRKRRGCHLLDYSADEDHNRLVVSVAGEPQAVQEALLASARAAIGRINMEAHRGEHPRIGAVDVIPFVPLQNMSMEEAVALARDFGRRYHRETGVPVYFYEQAAIRPERVRLEAIRKGQYEALKKEVSDPGRRPDLGPPRLHPTAGATVIGARKCLVAFNVNLATQHVEVARRIAQAVRASDGGLAHVKAIGVKLKERGLAQVSMNITDFEKNPLHRVLELVRAEARRWGVRVVESEICGMVPASALIEAAAYYLRAQGMDSAQVIELRLLQALQEEGL